MMKKYLALGDSYTIGEQTLLQDNFPNQLYRILHTEKQDYQPPQIIAKTGWTTDELAEAIAIEKPAFDHALVTLLIGVNNQYRGRSVEEYYWQFYSLMCQAILFAGSVPAHVIVLSIPDWGMTPFNKDLDAKTVSAEIDRFNAVNREIAAHFGAGYADVTTSTRQHAQDQDFLAPDLLHYAAKEYSVWANQVAGILK